MLVSFDYDGVIVDSLGQMLAIGGLATRTLGVGRAPRGEDFARVRDLTFDEIARVVGIPPDRHEQYASLVFGLLRDGYRDPPLFPGMAEVLRAVAGAHTVAVITSNSADVVWRVLEACDLASAVAAVHGGDEAGSKREKIERAAARLGLAPDDAVMVGDTVGDLVAGRAAGCRTVAVTWGYQPRELLAAEGPDHVVDTPAALAGVLLRASDV